MYLHKLVTTLSLGILLGVSAVSATTGSSGTCSKTQKCVSDCCSESGYCGFGPDFCGDDVCVSDCDAQAEYRYEFLSTKNKLY